MLTLLLLLILLLLLLIYFWLLGSKVCSEIAGLSAENPRYRSNIGTRNLKQLVKKNEHVV